MMNFLETYELLEWETDYYKQFWDNANKGILDVKSFHSAFDYKFKDFDLSVSDFFDPSTKLLKHKGIYGNIKSITDQKAFHLVRALKKFWALQFVDNAKLLSDIEAEQRKEQEEIRKQQREQEKKEKELLETRLREEKDRIITTIEETLNTFDISIIHKKIGEAEKIYLNTCKLINDPKNELDIVKRPKSLNTETHKVEAYINRFYMPALTININYSGIKTGLQVDNPDITEDELKELVLGRVNRAKDELMQELETDTSKMEEQFKDIESKTQSHDVDLINKLISEAKNKALDRYNSWSSSRYDDGNSQVAYNFSILDSVKDIYPYLVKCNVRYKDYEYTANGNSEDLCDLIADAIDKKGEVEIY